MPYASRGQQQWGSHDTGVTRANIDRGMKRLQLSEVSKSELSWDKVVQAGRSDLWLVVYLNTEVIWEGLWF